ncbi:hypothetical protein [Brasilonema sp. UFV-L1]|uniref:hypothetical protein n=1 Tax=Brasilonema sp. UFV-L1 TaxID=2234130 RepID=UPI00145E577F|nr:hypothetical protein [Brasilonema sp. UFV-L1]NMG06338.1 hypothetical protein [Brasilonema sp. UFV-L1]
MLKQTERLIKAVAKEKFYRVLNSVKLINERQLDQLILMNQYRQLADAKALPKFHEVGFHTYSQTDEDGFLLYIFSLIGTTNKKVVEICCGDGVECNAANLIINHGWKGLLFDGDAAQLKIGKKIYNFIKTTSNNPPQLVQAWITAENVNELIVNHGFEGEIDLLSLDLDGIDYWLWKSLNCIKPRVVVLEYNTYWGAEKSVTVPYDSNFRAKVINGAYYCGASLRAFVNLGNKLGYRLVGSNTRQFNAFFIRNDVGIDILPEVSVDSCLSLYDDCSKSLNQYNFPYIGELPWEEV